MTWTARTLGEIARQAGGEVRTGPFGSQLHKSDYVDDLSATPVVMPKDMVDGRVDPRSIARVDDRVVERLCSHVLRTGDIVLGRRGEIGRRAWTGDVEDGWLCGTGSMRITINGSTEVRPRFLFYYLGLPQTIGWLQGHAVGATMSNLSAGVVQQLPVRYPPTAVQDAIIKVLDAVENLIDNNRRRVAILEEATRLLYREWFVHFRYPGHEDVEFADSDLGPIPRGWAVRRLGEVLELSYGKALRASDRMGGPVAVYGSGGQVGWHDEALVSGPGIVVGRKGNVGSVYWTERDFFPIDTTYYVESDLPLRFLDQLLRTLHFVDSHAAVPGLSREQAYGLVVAEPHSNLMSLYDTAVDPMYNLRQVLSDQVAALREARDLLLPRLVSGELDVSELDLGLVAA